MADVIIVLVLVAVVALAVRTVLRRRREGSACCGPGEAAPERVHVADRNAAHYPYELDLAIGGMTCENCAIRVENALNELPGTWARVSIDTRVAHVRSKDEPDVDALRRAVAAAGYAVM